MTHQAERHSAGRAAADGQATHAEASASGMRQGRGLRNGAHGGAASERRGKPVALAVGIAAFLVGAYLFLLPLVTQYQAQVRADRQIAAAMQQAVDGLPASSSDAAGAEAAGDSADSASPAPKRAKEGDPAYDYLLQYNAKVASGDAGAINDPWGIGSNEHELAELGLPSAIVGSVSVPRLGQTLPLYFGASEEHMLYGACIVSGTSAPLGQTGSNCVLAAHRGLASGQAMFRDIEDMQVGDKITVETPWDTLTYQVAEICTIDPADADAVRVQPGRDLVTLLTCHPYGYNYQRILVICERAAADEPVAVQPVSPVRFVRQLATPCDSPNLVVERWAHLAGFALMITMLALALSSILHRLR